MNLFCCVVVGFFLPAVFFFNQPAPSVQAYYFKMNKMLIEQKKI